MSHLKRLMVVGAAAPLMLAAYAPSQATTPYTPPASPSHIVLAQAAADEDCVGEECPEENGVEADADVDEEADITVETPAEPEAGTETGRVERSGLRERLRERERGERRRIEETRERKPEAVEETVEEQDEAGQEATPEAGQPEAAEEEELRERLRERRQQEHADEETERRRERAAEESVESTVEEEPAETTAEEEREREPGIGERLRRAITGDETEVAPVAEDTAPDAEERERAEERGLRERLRERREGERAERPRRERPRDSERVREAQQELDDIAREREEIREDVEQLQEQRRVEIQAIEREISEQQEGEIVRRSEDRVVVRQDNRFYVQGNDSRRFMRRAENVETRRQDQGLTETVVFRQDGERVVTVRDRYGNIVTRARILRDGTEIVLLDNRRRGDRQRPRRQVDYYSQILPPLVIEIPRDEYIVETRRASRRDIRRALTAPPVEQVREFYTLDDVLYNERIRDMVARVDLDTITFEFDSAEVPGDQIDTLEDIGFTLEEIIEENPREIFLVEGHTDAPGSNEYNLALSDRRAENVAIILTEFFDIPPENLITQGYGEEYLKIDTQERERLNRRVTVRRITPLMADMR
jgi:outer membrane protein OmpA-like peptidoglycan-associated protein